MDTKKWYLSKTFWFNALTGLSLFFALPELQSLLGQHAIQFVLLGQATINIALRFISGTTLTK